MNPLIPTLNELGKGACPKCQILQTFKVYNKGLLKALSLLKLVWTLIKSNLRGRGEGENLIDKLGLYCLSFAYPESFRFKCYSPNLQFRVNSFSSVIHLHDIT